MSELNYEKDLRIDPNALDIEWLEQASVFMRYAEASAEAAREVDKAKELLEVTKAEVDSDIRQKTKKGDKKPTEAAILGMVMQDPRYQQALSDYNDVKHESAILSAAVKAFEQRKVALENLVRLHGASYFAGPSTPRELTPDFIAEAKGKRVASKARTKMREARTRRRTK